MSTHDKNTDWTSFHQDQIKNTQRRLIDHILSGNTTDYAPSPVFAEAAIYTSKTQYEIERREIFQKQPLLACLSSDMPEPGDVMLFNEAGVPIVITRDGNGDVHAFINACMHRL